MSCRVRSIATPLILLIAVFLMTVPASAAGLIVDAGAPNGSDDTATLQAILDAGDFVSLRPGQTYRLSERLNITQSNSGILTNGTPAVLYLKNTFNNVDPLQMWDAARVDSVAIRAEGNLGALLKNIRLENFKIEKQYLDGTYVSAVWFRGVKNSKIIGLDITGFALGPIVAIDSATSVSIRGCNIHDSWATYVNSYARFPQLSGIVVDDNKLSSGSGQAVGSTGVTIANNTIARLRFGNNIYNLQRGLFPGMSGNTSPVGYQTDGITVVPGGSDAVIVGNVIETVGEGIDCMGQAAVIRSNKVRDVYYWGIKFVHGAKNGLVEDNDIGAAGVGSVVVSGTLEPSYGDTTGQLIRNNRISQVGGLNAFCGSAVPAPYRISPCQTNPAAAYSVIPNGSVGWPRYNLFSGNTVTAVSTDTRMQSLIRIDTPADYSLFFANIFSNQTGRTIGNQIEAGVVGTIIDPSAINVVLADFNGDGRNDWFVDWKASGQNYLYRQNSNGTFTRSDNLINPSGINGNPDNLLNGDFNNDGRADVLFHWKNTGTNRLFLSTAAGSFNEVDDPMSVSNVGGNPDDALTGDFNGDGATDIFFYWRQAGTNRFYYGAANGTFTERLNPIPVAAINETPNKVLVGDFDGDTKSDLLFFWNDGTNRFYYGTGTGTFANVDNPISTTEISGSPQTVITLDANQDGRDDLLFWWPAGELRQMYLGRGNRTFLRE